MGWAHQSVQVLAVLAVCALGTVYDTVDQELQEPPVVSSAGGALSTTLSLDEWTYSGPDSLSFNTRAYNGRLPGPTLRFRRGDVVTVTMQNHLSDCAHPGPMNQLRDPCVTNLHTHGLHIGSRNPEDNVFVEIEPGHEHVYTYTIPPDHLGGTHWYHPHHHGSTALQVGGGASGMLVVEDEDEDGLPVEFRNMTEKLVVMTLIHTDLPALDSASGASFISSGPSAPLLLFNGMTRPRITWTADTWMRFRMVLSAVQHYVVLLLPSECEGMLLAKDGVWLPSGARAVSRMLFAPGNRNDVAVRCVQGGPYDLTTVAAAGGFGGGGGGDGGGAGYGGGMAEFPAQTVATFYATGSSAAVELPALSVVFPEYLATLVDTTADELHRGIDLGGGEECNFGCGVFDPAVKVLEMSKNSVQEFSAQATEHPLHMHINHMQLTAVNNANNQYVADWHQVGDWVDTLLGSATVRFKTERYSGEAVVHCHLLVHEDEGCMGIMEIVDSGTPRWGVCLGAGFRPTAPCLTCCFLALIVSVTLTVVHAGYCCAKVRARCPCCTGRIFGYVGLVLQLGCVIVAILPMVNDGRNGMVESFHLNEANYYMMLGISVPTFIITLVAAAAFCVVLLRKGRPTREPVKTIDVN